MRKEISLNGRWKLNYFEINEGEKNGVYKQEYNDSNWFDIEVPNDIRISLLDNKKIEDPFLNKNIEDQRWLEDKEWWYRKRFTLDPRFEKEKLNLIFEGLDTYCKIWLNDKELGEHKNMFRPFIVDVSNLLKFGEQNTIAIKFDSVIRKVESIWKKKPLDAANYAPRVYVRKAQFSFIWDWNPRLITIGIWKPVKLLARKDVSIEDIFIIPKIIEENKAQIDVEFLCLNLTEKKQKVTIKAVVSIDSQVIAEKTFDKELSEDKTTVRFNLLIENPKLWWPNGMGEQNLYQLSINISKEGNIISRRSERFGIREVKLVQEPLGGEGKSFTFVINGTKVFAKGANWVPPDALITRAIKDKYSKLLEMAKEANFNMLRIWGGGIYEDDTFYTLCDELGIMVWQDFMFACGQYPEDTDFLEEVKREAEYNIKRLRNHPSIVLWCGNNENDWLVQRGTYKGEKLYGKVIYYDILPKICTELDGTRPYWPSSPYGGAYPNSPWEGNRHCYRVFLGDVDTDQLENNLVRFDYLHYKNYAQEYGKFISEFGAFLSAPKIEELARFICNEKLYPRSEEWIYHAGFSWFKTSFTDILELFIENIYGKKTLEKALKDTKLYIELSQEIQAEGLKYGIEHFRKRKFYCSGCLFWQFNDSWPCISWSVIDYSATPKPSYYYVKRSYSPVMIVLSETGQFGQEISTWIVNDTLKEVRGELEIALQTFNGEIKWCKKIKISVPPNMSKHITSVRFSELPLLDRKNDFLYAKLICDSTHVKNVYFLEEIGKLNLPEANLAIKKIDMQKTMNKAIIKLKLSTDKFARFVKISSSLDSLDSIYYSDNCFDLLPGECETIEIYCPIGIEFQVKAKNSDLIIVKTE